MRCTGREATRRGSTGSALRGLCLLALLVLPVLLAPPAEAAVVRYSVTDADGLRLARVTYDNEKAVRVGQERGFLFNVAPVNASLNASLRLDVRPGNATALHVTDAPERASLGRGPVTLTVRLHATPDAEPRRYPVSVHLVLLNPQGVNASTIVTHVDYPMNVTLSRLPTPLGETGSTLSMGEWITLGSFAMTLVGVAVVHRVARNARRRAR